MWPLFIFPGRARACALGVTLIELLLVLAIVAVLGTLAVPSISSMLASNLLISTTNTFVNSLVLARSEAIKRNARAAVCKSLNGRQCDFGGGWENGWLVFHDANNNGRVDDGEFVILRQGPLGGNLKISGNQTVANFVSFAPTGGTELLSGAFQAGTITICSISPNANVGYQVVINAIGRARSARASLPNC